MRATGNCRRYLPVLFRMARVEQWLNAATQRRETRLNAQSLLVLQGIVERHQFQLSSHGIMICPVSVNGSQQWYKN